MSVWDAIANLFRGPSATAASPLLVTQRYNAIADLMPSFTLGKARWPDHNVERYDAQVYRKVALIFRCLSLITHAAGTAKVRVYDESNEDDELADHPMRRLIRQPNRHMGEARFWGNVALRAGVAGFCVVEKERDGFGDVVALNPLRSPWLKAIPRGGGIYDWEYRVPGMSPVPVLKSADVVVFTWADTPDGSPYGLPPLATVVRDVAILDKLTEFLGNLLDRGGVPQWMLIQDSDAATMDQTELDEWTEAFVRRRGGFDKRGIPWLAEGIKDAKQLSYDPTELAMEAVRDLSDLAICMAFGVPPRKAGVRVGLEHTTQNATAGVEDGEFYRDTIVPLWSRLDDALTTGLLPDFEPPDSTVSLEFDVSDIEALQEDRNEKAKSIVMPGFVGGLLSNHMALKELGMAIPDGLPEYYLRGIAVEAIPADDPLQAKEPPPVKTPPPALPDGQQGALSALVVIPGTNGHLKRPGPSQGYAKRKAIGASNKKLIASIADAREPSLRRFLKAQANRIAAHAAQPLGVGLAGRNGHSMYSIAEIDWNAEDDKLKRELRSLYLLAGETAFDAVAEQVGVELSFDLANPKLRAVIDKLALRVTGITTETRDQIAEIVTKGAEQGLSTSEIAEQIRESTAFSAGRASTIARTESQVSLNSASALGYRESGVVDRIQMFDNPAHDTDPMGPTNTTCADREGLIAPLDMAEDYIASAHPNCVLALSPVLAGEE